MRIYFESLQQLLHGKIVYLRHCPSLVIQVDVERVEYTYFLEKNLWLSKQTCLKSVLGGPSPFLYHVLMFNHHRPSPDVEQIVREKRHKRIYNNTTLDGP